MAAAAKPDLSGLWQRLRTPARAVRAPTRKFMRPGEKTPPPAPSGQALYRQRQAQFHGGPANKTLLAAWHPGRDAHRCATQDPPELGSNSNAHPVRRIRTIPPDFLRSTPHPTVSQLAWLGYSIGRWDGNWCVVDTRDFNHRSWLDDGRPSGRRSAYPTWNDSTSAISVIWRFKSRSMIRRRPPSHGRFGCNLNFSPIRR